MKLVDNNSRLKSTERMKYLDLTYEAPEHNLACDEVLLAQCEAGEGSGLLRTWESPRYFVVAGYSNKVATEVDGRACAKDGLPILRRCTGGGAVLQGPGCLNYTLILDHEADARLSDLEQTYRFVLGRHREFLAHLIGTAVTINGTSDLTIDGRKFSGNSQYRRRRWTLVHGTFLLSFDLARIPRYLPMPSKEPGYRRRRAHADFLINLNVDGRDVRQGLRRIWHAQQEISVPPVNLIQAIARSRYSRQEWNLKF
jgi:lipoate-protein ligase A